MERKCIFCREPSEDFVPEHVFPAAIGGAFVILNVCGICNKERLGKKIDDGLSKNKIVLFYRKLFDVKRKGILGDRKIPNPFKGTGLHSDKFGNKHYVSFNDEKKEFEPNLVPVFEFPTPDKNAGWIGKVTMPLKDFTSDEEIKNIYAKKIGINPSEIGEISKEINQQNEVELKLSAPNKPFILGCLKIAYEFAVTFLPKYLEDNYSKVFADILLNNTITNEQKNYFELDNDIQSVFTNRISQIKDLRQFHHIALIKTIKGKGLYCAVKIFDLIYSIRLSDKEDYLNANELLIINDSIQQAFWINLQTKLTHFNITTDLAYLNFGQRQAIQMSKGVGCQTSNGNTPVFNKNGEMTHNHIEELAKELQILPQHYSHFDKQIIVPVEYENRAYFIKYFNGNFLVPIQRVDFIYTLLY